MSTPETAKTGRQGMLVEDASGARFSPCRKYRYALWRRWDWQGFGNQVMFIGLNPSTADERKNDKTISNCIGFAKRWGYGGIVMMNLYPFRATYPSDLIACDAPTTPANLEAFGYYRTHVGLIVAAWGSLKVPWRPRMQWQSTIQNVLHAISQPVYCLGRTKDGSPRHPSRLGYDRERELFWTPTSDEPVEHVR